MTAVDWFLTARERNNRYTIVDRRHPDGAAFTSGNRVRALVHGSEYFEDLCARVQKMVAGDLILFTDWRGDPDERLASPRPECVHSAQ